MDSSTHNLDCAKASLQDKLAELQKAHKEYKLFKEFLKTQSSLLRNYIEMSKAAAKNCSENKHLQHYRAAADVALQQHSKFLENVTRVYKQLSTSYTILKVQGKSFYRVSDESNSVLKRCQETYKEQRQKASNTDKKLQKVQQAQQTFYPAKDMNKSIMNTQYQQQYSRLNEEFQLCKQELEECQNNCKLKILNQCKAIDEQIKRVITPTITLSKAKQLIKGCYQENKENQEDSECVQSKSRRKETKTRRFTSPRFAELQSHKFPVCQSQCQSQASFSNDMRSYAKSEEKSQKTIESQLLQSQLSKMKRKYDDKPESSINDRLEFSLQEQQLMKDHSKEIKQNESSYQ